MADSLSNDARDHAEALALLISSGFVAAREAMDWACELVAAQAQPSEELLELAGAVRTHPPDVVRMLRALPGSSDENRVFCRFAARLRQFLADQPQAWPRVARELEFMAMNEVVPQRVRGDCYRYADALDLADEGIVGTREGVHAELLAFLDREAGLADARASSRE
jgi:hypothetical protein